MFPKSNQMLIAVLLLSFNKDYLFEVTDRAGTEIPWTVYGTVDIQEGVLTYAPTIGAPDLECSALMLGGFYKMHNDDQLRFFEVPDYPCTEFGKRIIYFMIMEWFYFG